MKYLKYIVILFFVLKTHAQKITNKTFSAEGISELYIDGSSVFKITIETAKTDTISINSFAEGENNEQIVLLTEINKKQLHVTAVYQPLFVEANDKLSVHKLISIEFQIVIPEDLAVNISSNIASIFMYGKYKEVTTELINGSFNAENFYGDLLVNTIYGDINVNSNLASVNVSSKHGKINQDVLMNGKHQISLNSINGNIRVTKIE